jgi:hypothetical protein
MERICMMNSGGSSFPVTLPIDKETRAKATQKTTSKAWAEYEWTRSIWARISPILRDYLKGGLGYTLSTAFLAFGGLIFLAYFWHIGFMPEVDLNSAITLLFISAVTGLVVSVWLGLLIILPGWIWASTTKEKVNPLWLVIPWSIVMISYPILLLVLPSWWWLPVRWWKVSVIFSPVIISIAAFFADRRRWEHTWDFIRASVTAGGLLAILTVLLPVAAISARPESKHVPWPYLIFMWNFAIYTIFLSSAAAHRAREPLDERPFPTELALACVFTLILVVTMLAPNMPSNIMRLYRLGSFRATVIVDETGCAIADLNGFKQQTAASNNEHLANGKPEATPISRTCPLFNITILSRVGNAYYVRKDAKSGCFTIPSQHVISWAVAKRVTITEPATIADPPCR